MIVTIRASSFGDLFDCPARWAYIHLNQGHQGERTQSARAWLGTSIHHATAVFDQSVIDSGGVTIDDATGAFIDYFKAPETPIRWLDLEKKEAQKIGTVLVDRYCRTISPQMTWESVELKLNPLELNMGKVTLHMTGHTDRIRREHASRGISDLKSGARLLSDGKLNASKHIYQVGTYEVLAQMAAETTKEPISLPAQIIGLPTTGNLQPEVGYVEGASRILTGAPGEKGLFEMARDMLVTGNFFGNPRSSLCSETWCPAHPTCRWIGNAPQRGTT